MNKNKQCFLPCAIGVVLCLLIASIEGVITATHTNQWYNALNKPVFNPPSFVFAPVWTALYIMIGIAGGLIWSRKRQHQTLFIVFSLQLLFNFLWSFLFFLWGSISWALIDISLLWITLLITLLYAYKQYKAIFYWLTPYFIWVSFATILNLSLWLLN